MSISVIIPALNECESIGQVVASMPWELIAECIVVDNGSTDGTGEVAAAAGARVVRSPRGYGSACKAGSAAALASSTILVYLDGDGSDVIADLARLTTPIERNEADFTIGSRIRGHVEPGSMLSSQIFAAHLVGWLLRVMQGVRYTDTGPFRAIRRSSFERASNVRVDLRLESGDADQGGAAQASRPRTPRGLSPPYWRHSKVSGDLRASFKAAVRILGVFFRIGLSRRL
jgi:glycosyltransferase involved in cell wall biosynthesis